jgi:AraC-like DNA-binding protein
MRRIRHASALGAWELAVAPPHPRLRGCVREYVGGVEFTAPALVRRELPADVAPVIFNFGPPFRVFDTADPSRWTDVRSFVAGAFDAYALVGSTGPYSVLQVNFTILGLRRFCGRPIHDLRDRVVPLDAVFGARVESLTAELHGAASWEERFAILDREILARVDRGREVPPWIRRVRQRLVQTTGQAPIRDLVGEVGYSHKHVVEQFTHEFGIGPKAFARVLRFGRAAEQLQVCTRERLADIALGCGYYDQAHFTRDFRAFAGVSPTELLATRLPDRGGFTA